MTPTAQLLGELRSHHIQNAIVGRRTSVDDQQRHTIANIVTR
jgi:hypothetical protein